jgi:Icc-related predicted phosphoesterase
MRILAIADEEVPQFYDFYRDGVFDGYDMILACGDLSRRYLEFIATMARCPVYYVRGNHDEDFGYYAPGGCICIEDRVHICNGIRVLGLGGSYRYRDGTNFYTEKQMVKRIKKLWFSLWHHKGFDILLTHAPAYQLNDMDNLSHRGFECFIELMDKYAPKYFIHGHVHRNYGIDIPQKCKYNNTTVINACGYCVIEYDEK